jgi:glycosyltransferase involved in cell wall biosynthesis
VDTRFAAVEKSNLILSVGRFTGADIRKNQIELAWAFRKMAEAGLRGWQFACAGSLRGTDQDYFDEVRRIAPPQHSRLLANLGRAELAKLYERAKIFWHAAGYGQDDASRPESMEHFGIVTVEAMAAGCVPVVINKGGQSEIVEHGVNGFLWNTLDELAGYTLRLIEDEDLQARMSVAARARGRAFDRNHFVARFEDVIEPFLMQRSRR